MNKFESKQLERNTLIHLLCESTQRSEICNEETHKDCRTAKGDCGFCTITADFLLKKGVILPQFKLGDEVWVVNRCENDYSGYMVLAQAGNYVIATSYINDYDLNETLEYLVEDTLDNMDTDLCVFRLDDCFATKEEAEKELEEEEECYD